MNLRGILFDLDGTLGDTLPVCVGALQETLYHFTHRDYTKDEIFSMFGPSEEGMIYRFIPEPQRQAALDDLHQRYTRLHESARQPFPGVIPLLETLKRRGVRTGIVTGKGRGTAEISLEMMGLAPYIETLVTGSPEGAEKPASIRQALAQWRLPAGEVAYVGDMPYDMLAAREAGVIPLGAAWAQTATVRDGDGAVKVFHSVDELAGWLDEELAAARRLNPPV